MALGIINKKNKIMELRIWLESQERTPSWLARHLKVSPTAVKMWLDGDNYPTIKNRLRIKEVTGVQL